MSRTDKDRPYKVRRADSLDGEFHRPWFFWMDGPPGWYINMVWNSPERNRQRMGLRAAAREYNAHGECDDFDYENRPHRNRASYWWW